jgi:hypothetical protein
MLPERNFWLTAYGIAGLLALAVVLAFLESSPWSIAACVAGVCLLVGSYVSRCMFVEPEPKPFQHGSLKGRPARFAHGLRIYKG